MNFKSVFLLFSHRNNMLQMHQFIQGVPDSLEVFTIVFIRIYNCNLTLLRSIVYILDEGKFLYQKAQKKFLTLGEN